MAIREISFPSYNGRDTIQGWVYTPITEPKAVVQVVHGFGEHSRRYMHMILQFLDAGFVVCADDHVGHGKTAAVGDSWGDFGYKGYATTTEDEKTLHDMLAKEYPELPYFMFGHSWGSMITRDYLSKYGDGLSGAVLCGTVSILEGTVATCEKLKALVDAGQGKEVKPELMGDILGGMTGRYEDVKTPNDWIAVHPGVVADHAADPFNNLGNPPNVQALYDFVQLWVDINSPEWAAKVPKLPLYVIAGDQDPVGGYGEGVYQVANWLWATGKNNITTKLYSGYRHEIHNEPDLRDEVEAGIVEFIDILIST